MWRVAGTTYSAEARRWSAGKSSDGRSNLHFLEAASDCSFKLRVPELVFRGGLSVRCPLSVNNPQSDRVIFIAAKFVEAELQEWLDVAVSIDHDDTALK
jgi:hypothetical protein